MEFLKKHYRLVLVTAFLILYSIFFKTAKDIIKEGAETIKEVKEKEDFEIKPAEVTVTIDSGTGLKTYEATLENIDTVRDLLERLRDQNGLTYEQLYTTGPTIITEINGVKIDKTTVWNVYDGETLITNFADYKLDDQNQYFFKLEKISK